MKTPVLINHERRAAYKCITQYTPKEQEVTQTYRETLEGKEQNHAHLHPTLAWADTQECLHT